MSCTVCGSGSAKVGDGAGLVDTVSEDESEGKMLFVEGVGEAGDERAGVEEEETGNVEEPSS